MSAQALKATLERAVRDLYPGYFALVMATGIVSIAAHLLQMPAVAWPLFWINVAAYAVLWALTLIRLVAHYSRLMGDLADHASGPGFFTVVAGTCVLGAELVVLTGALYTAALLWVLGLVLWFVLMYGFFTAITVRADKPGLAAGINGAWLIAIVATQSVSILGTLIADLLQPWGEALLFFTLVMYLFGCMLYILTITLIFYRIVFFRLDPEQLTPPYWINMGAVAITTLAGATLILAEPKWSLLGEIAPFLTGFTLFFWATATWWIPLLFLLGAWRHLYRRFPFRYDPQYWGMVFPLGMYAACTFQLAEAADLSLLVPIARGFGYLAVVAWLVAFVGMLYVVGSGLAACFRPAVAAAGGAVAVPGGRGAPPSPVTFLLHCPVHGVDAWVRVSVSGVGRAPIVQECSLHPGLGSALPCERSCVVVAVDGGTDASANASPVKVR